MAGNRNYPLKIKRSPGTYSRTEQLGPITHWGRSESSGTELPARRQKQTSRFGFAGLSKSAAFSKGSKEGRPSRPSEGPSTPVASSKELGKPPGTPLSRGPFTQSNSPSKQTPTSVRSMASLFGQGNPSPGPLTDPALAMAASTTVNMLRFEPQTSTDLTAPGDVSFGTNFGDYTQDEEGNVSALLPVVSFDAPTPSHPRISFTRAYSGHPEDDDDDDEDIDEGHDDDPTVQLQMQTPSRPPQRKPRGRQIESLGLPPTRQNMSYLSPTLPTSGGFSFFNPERPRPTSASRSRKVSATSSSAAKNRSRRTSQYRRPGADRGSLMTWDAIVERSKEFSDGDIDELGMISGIALPGLGAMSPGFGTPAYRLSFGTDRDGSRSRPSSMRGGSKINSPSGASFKIQGSEAGSEAGSTFLHPPETPSPSGQVHPSSSGRRGPPLPISPTSTVGNGTGHKKAKVTKQPGLDGLRRELDNQTLHIKLLEQKLQAALSDAESKAQSISRLEALRASLEAEGEAQVAALEAWEEKERQWGLQREAWASSSIRQKEFSDLKDRVALESEIKWQWSTVRSEVEKSVDQLQHDRSVLAVLFSQINLTIKDFNDSQS